MGAVVHHPLAQAQRRLDALRAAGRAATGRAARRRWQQRQHEASRRLEIARAARAGQ